MKMPEAVVCKRFLPFLTVLVFIFTAPSVWGDTGETAEENAVLEAEAKGNQDLQMIAKQMEFLSGRLNRMPAPPKMDATLMINPGAGEDYVSKRGGLGNEDDVRKR